VSTIAYRRCCGLDVHKKLVVVHVLPPEGYTTGRVGEPEKKPGAELQTKSEHAADKGDEKPSDTDPEDRNGEKAEN
jgi:hypothetical protein